MRSLSKPPAAALAAERANERQQRLAAEGIIPRKDAEQAAADLAGQDEQCVPGILLLFR